MHAKRQLNSQMLNDKVSAEDKPSRSMWFS